MELKHYLVVLRRWGWIMLLCMLVAGVASYWFSSQQPRVYEAQARYLIGSVLDNPNVSVNDLRASSQIGQTYAELATSRPLLQRVIEKLGLSADADSLASNVTATWIDVTQILNIRVRAADSESAANIANAIGEALIERSPAGPSSVQAARRQEATTQIARLQESIRTAEAQIDQLNNQIQQTADETAQRVLIGQLEQRSKQLAEAQRALSDQYALLEGGSTNQITSLEPAVPEAAVQVAPQIRQNVLAALLAGLVLGLAAMLLCDYFTAVIYTPDELREATGLAYLGGIVRHKRLRGSGASQLVVQARPETLAAESYRILRTNLQRVAGDTHLASLLITSPSDGDGKSEIAANLALSFVQTGKQVILIDANLRRPRLASLFKVPNHQGLSDLLEMPQQLLQPTPVDSVPGLWVLSAGEPVLSSSEILSSQQMHRLIQEFKQRADVVILDSAPLPYSDTLALAPQVDGVLLVVSSSTTDRESTIKAVESLRLVGAHLVGTVLNRIKAGSAYSYYPTHVTDRPNLAIPVAAEATGGPGKAGTVYQAPDPATRTFTNRASTAVADESNERTTQALPEFAELAPNQFGANNYHRNDSGAH